MVLIAAAVCTKAGKTIISRQFVEMTKARIEGLLSAFPKLMSTGKQHTFVETESVRYVYQPLEKLYMLLITTKASNILEDLETLRLFSRVIPEYCRSMEESEIADNAFNLIFAFDEIVALGYRESVNLAQIRTFVEMDSHEEKVYQAVRQTQEREAKNKMREKAKELQRQRMEANKKGVKSPGFGGGGFGSNTGYSPAPIVGDSASIQSDSNKPSFTAIQKPTVTTKAMKLGSKSRDVESFVDQLKSEGENVVVPAVTRAAPTPRVPVAADSTEEYVVLELDFTLKQRSQERNVETRSKGQATLLRIFFTKCIKAVKEKRDLFRATLRAFVLEVDLDLGAYSVHLRQEERLMLRVGRDGGLQNFELHGLVTLHIADDKMGRIRVQLENKDTRGIQLQTHPNVDKELFKSKSQVGLKNPAKPFPIHTDVGVLKWRFQTQDESCIPLSINCWPSENGQGGCDVNIEYELEHDHMELNDVCITIPLPIGSSPVVNECDGEYTHDPRKNVLLWTLPVIDASNKSGSLEFSATALPGDFFPLQINFVSNKSYADLMVTKVLQVDDDSPMRFSVDTVFFTEKYEIV